MLADPCTPDIAVCQWLTGCLFACRLQAVASVIPNDDFACVRAEQAEGRNSLLQSKVERFERQQSQAVVAAAMSQQVGSPGRDGSSAMSPSLSTALPAP